MTFYDISYSYLAYCSFVCTRLLHSYYHIAFNRILSIFGYLLHMDTGSREINFIILVLI